VYSKGVFKCIRRKSARWRARCPERQAVTGPARGAARLSRCCASRYSRCAAVHIPPQVSTVCVLRARMLGRRLARLLRGDAARLGQSSRQWEHCARPGRRQCLAQDRERAVMPRRGQSRLTLAGISRHMEHDFCPVNVPSQTVTCLPHTHRRRRGARRLQRPVASGERTAVVASLMSEPVRACIAPGIKRARSQFSPP
jgi:hypothetical protein